MEIKKAVFPVAGLGTRFLPATKASPKEMLPIVDKPLIQYAVEEAVAAGIYELIFVTGRQKRAIEDHFDSTCELEVSLKAHDNHHLLADIRSILPEHVSCIYIRQKKPLGLGHAILCARSVIGNEPFAVILADDLINANPGCIAQMVEIYAQYHSVVLAVEPILMKDTNKYGVIRTHGDFVNRVGEISTIVEKPPPSRAPSNLGVVGRYILTPDIFERLAALDVGGNGEIQLTDGISLLLENRPMMALEFTGKRYDCGSKIGFLKATVEYALDHSEVKREFRDYLATLDFNAWNGE
uniref:UTP--glucose-1-phosphate uridylyltransferase n=1 Tax=Candidatus Kentrum sp. TUN TaxID=2126343 RepID=A0A450ZYN8_9GAMM|nr:MAG: UDP-glucose pyrophosphorylase [Candidatus Kentron sp. TUN]VFK54003.1 MAG: UDP-glucose pyrophosphorylase [Candidatus Kentron sp. TUN]VFK58909.1 MAG: UDP-glucose pyrophosphorylase [Candidatus Kentron sp. TUN]